jgi:hypothetical protein
LLLWITEEDDTEKKWEVQRNKQIPTSPS